MTDQDNTAARAGHAAEGHARNVQESAATHAREVTDEAVTQARTVAEQGMSEFRHQADEQIDRVAEYLDDLGHQLRGMAAGERTPDGVLADLVAESASKVERFAGHLHTGGYDAALSDARRFARRRPGTFLVSAFGAGLVVGRILRNTELSHLTDSHDGDGRRADADTFAMPPQPASRAAVGAPASATGVPASPTGPAAVARGPR